MIARRMPRLQALNRQRPDSLRVTVTFVGQRSENNVFDDGHADVARFVGNEDIEGGVEPAGSVTALVS